MPKVKRSKGGGGNAGAAEMMGLADQILHSDTVRPQGRVKNRDQVKFRGEDDEYVDERLSRKILEQARIQQEELQTEFGLAPEKKKPSTSLGMCLSTLASY